MKLSIASRGGVVAADPDEQDAIDFARMIEDQAEHDEWVRILYAVEKPDTAEIEVLAFRLEREPTRKSG